MRTQPSQKTQQCSTKRRSKAGRFRNALSLLSVPGRLGVPGLAALVTLGALGVLVGSSVPSTASAVSSRQNVSGSITVSAAASLSEVFGSIGAKFEKRNPMVRVTANYGSSGLLEAQIESGAPVDVAAFADQPTIAKLSDKGLLDGRSQVFATNHLVIVTKPGNPDHIRSLADLARVGTVSLCAPSAPCGVFADRVLHRAGVEIPESRVARGQDVKATLTAVAEGDARAGIVYVTDARSAHGVVATVTIPKTQDVVAKYPIAVIRSSSNVEASQAFVRFVRGAAGRAELEKFGFGAP